MAGLQTDDAVFQGISEAKKDEYLSEKQLGLVSETSHPATEDGIEFPSEEDRINLRRVPGTIPWPAFLIAVIECAERFSYYGSTVVFTNFIQQRRPAGSATGACGDGDCTSGALGKGQQASTGLTTFNSFWVYVMPLLGAYMADAHWGRYKTISIAVGIAMVGHVLLVISAIPPVLDNPTGGLGLFIVAILIMGVGTGGFKSSISPLVAEQMPEQRLTVQTTKKGERVILDPALTSSRIYLYFYLMINVGALIGQIGMSYSEKYVGFWLAYLLPTVVFFICPIVLYAGRNRYVRTPPKGSIFGSAWRTFKLAAKGKWSLNPITTYRNFNRAGFWDAAKPSMFTPEERPAWMTHDDIFVDELSRAINACFVFCYFPIYWLTYNQLNNNLTSQAAVMKTNGVPNDVLSNLDPFALIILIPICDKFIYPGLRKLGINFTPIKRMAFGFFTGSAAMIWACVIQQYIYNMSECGYNAAGLHEDGETPCAPVNINVWAQTGSYVLIAISEIFASITGLEYAFSKAPKSMRSMVMAIFLFMSAFSSAIGEAFVPISADPLLVWNYGSMAVLSFLAGVLFWFQFRHLDAQEHVLNEIGRGAPGEAAKRNAIEHPQEKHTSA